MPVFTFTRKHYTSMSNLLSLISMKIKKPIFYLLALQTLTNTSSLGTNSMKTCKRLIFGKILERTCSIRRKTNFLERIRSIKSLLFLNSKRKFRLDWKDKEVHSYILSLIGISIQKEFDISNNKWSICR